MPSDLPSWMPLVKLCVTVAAFAILWSWESVLPLMSGRRNRLRHAGRNVVIAVVNTVVLAVVFGTVTVVVATWTQREQFGLLNWLQVPWPWRILPAVLLLDLWLYAWHRLNHVVPFLWRFHRMHHADTEMDVTTATRFHLGEHLMAATLRLGLVPLFGVNVLEILIYETLVVANTMFHHANITIGSADPLLRWLIVTPRMHQIHHSRQRFETNSNYSTLFSFWDRALRTFQMRAGSEPVDLGLDEFREDRWQTVGGMLKTPLAERWGGTP